MPQLYVANTITVWRWDGAIYTPLMIFASFHISRLAIITLMLSRQIRLRLILIIRFYSYNTPTAATSFISLIYFRDWFTK